MSEPTTMDHFMAPQWAGGWVAVRLLWVWCCLMSLLPRYKGLGDAYGAPDVIFVDPWIGLNDLVEKVLPHDEFGWHVAVNFCLTN